MVFPWFPSENYRLSWWFFHIPSGSGWSFTGSSAWASGSAVPSSRSNLVGGTLGKEPTGGLLGENHGLWTLDDFRCFSGAFLVHNCHNSHKIPRCWISMVGTVATEANESSELEWHRCADAAGAENGKMIWDTYGLLDLAHVYLCTCLVIYTCHLHPYVIDSYMYISFLPCTLSAS